MLFNETFAAYLKPPPNLRLSEYAENRVRISSAGSAASGRWHSYPYQPGIMDMLTDPQNETVTLQKSTRVGYTQIITHAIRYHIEIEPCPQMAVQPTVEDAEGYSKDEIASMIRGSAALSALVADSKTRDSNNTILRKVFPGGFLVIVGANSARGFRRLTVRIVYFDEVDAYPPSAGSEGDQIKLGTRRTDTFWNRLIVIGGTPTIKHFSRVERHFLAGDQRRYYVPCPTCAKMQYLKWKNFIIPEKDPARTHYQCEACNRPIDEKEKFRIMEKGRWIAGAEFKGNASAHIWAAYSYAPKTTWPAIAAEFLEAKDNPVLLRVFVNTILGETWEDRGEAIEVKNLQGNKEQLGDEIDAGALLITAGADVQKDRIEAEIVAWGRGFESWSLDYIVIPGDPHFPETWKLLDEKLMRRFVRADGLPMRIHTAFIDSGYATSEVYRYTYPRQSRRIYATKGQAVGGNQLVKASKQKYKRGLKLLNIATIGAKDKIFAYLRLQKAGPGYCHFPARYGDDYFDGLTAEQRFKKMVKGVPSYFYKKVRTRNEPLDCRVLALAACEYASPKWDSLEKNLNHRAEMAAQKSALIEPPETAAIPAKDKPRPARKHIARRHKGGPINDW